MVREDLVRFSDKSQLGRGTWPGKIPQTQAVNESSVSPLLEQSGVKSGTILLSVSKMSIQHKHLLSFEFQQSHLSRRFPIFPEIIIWCHISYTKVCCQFIRTMSISTCYWPLHWKANFSDKLLIFRPLPVMDYKSAKTFKMNWVKMLHQPMIKVSDEGGYFEFWLSCRQVPEYTCRQELEVCA